MNKEGKDIKDVIGEIFKTNKSLSRSYNEYTIEQLWRDNFGELISQYTTDVKFKKGQLTVYISSSALKQELSMNKESVISKMNESIKYNKINKLVIV